MIRKRDFKENPNLYDGYFILSQWTAHTANSIILFTMVTFPLWWPLKRAPLKTAKASGLLG